LRFAICDLTAVFFDDAVMATISLASVNKDFTLAARSNSVSIINSSQNAVSICFFFDKPELCNELWFRTSSARRPVICCHRCTAPDQLGSNRSSLNRLR
jgi:hypothetical protein